jgi:hypothetical protein
MVSRRKGSPGRPPGRRLGLWAGMAACGIAASVGCQVEYAGMTLPSGKYMYDDVQYFPEGPEFPWANTQAATQRARLAAQGLETFAPGTGPVVAPPPAAGAIEPIQAIQGRPADINAQPLPPVPRAVPAPGAPGANVPPGAVIPPPGGAAAPPGGAGMQGPQF